MNLEGFFWPLLRQLALDPSGNIIVQNSAIRYWPKNVLAAAERAKILEPARIHDFQICSGCNRGCIETVIFIDGSGFIPCRHADVDNGLIELNSQNLRQWHASRSRLAAFVAREFKLSPPEQYDHLVSMRLGTWRGARLRRVATLEFAGSSILRIGDSQLQVSELLRLRGGKICFDHDELELLASQSTEHQTGGKRYQRSRLKQQFAAQLTALRNQRLQERADLLASAHPSWKKSAIAHAIMASDEFGEIRTRSTLERLIKLPRKMRRRNFA